MTDAAKTETRPASAGEVPDPFEDIPAPPLRLTPRPARPRAVAPAPAPRPPARASEAVIGAVELPAPVPPAEQPPLRALPHAPAAGGARREIALALVVGLAIAAAIVAGAVYLRPSGTPTALGSGPVPAQTRADTPVSDVSVRIRLPGNAPAPKIEALRGALSAAGFHRVDVETRNTPIEETRIDYFRPEDRAAAEALAEAVAPLVGGPLAAQAVSATGPVSAGRVDLWMAE